MTKYLIVLAETGMYLDNHPSGHHWTNDMERAKRFDSMTEAELHAMELLASYTLKPVEVRNADTGKY